jgi:type VI secretion system secreted protein VgrG
MPIYTQAHRPIAIKTPLGKDLLLLTGLQGCEGISQLFSFELSLLAESKEEIRFDQIIGQKVSVEMRLPGDKKRFFTGLIKRFSQGMRDETFVHYHAELVPDIWLLTKKVRSRIFQHLTVPDILRRLFKGKNVEYEFSATYYPRDYCVQYRESEFEFASRLMEEEGIFYYFTHGDNTLQMVVKDGSTQHPEISGQSNVIFDEILGGMRSDLRITFWEKTQEVRAGEYTLWDHSFELPHKHLEAKQKTIASVAVGSVTHKLDVCSNDRLEIYDYPGGYAQRFDGIDGSGTPRPQELQDIFPDSQRTVKVRMEQEEMSSLELLGASNCGHFVTGHRFALKRHFDGDDRYLLTSVKHSARLDGDYRSSQAQAFTYENQFTCIPVALPYRPRRVTPKPVIAGIQTATVVGPQGEVIFCDKYGRVKIQFHWDREGKKDSDSSCWVRVAQVWAGRGWGAFFWPRVGHEVVVIFEEGDPDQPLIIGSVYNAENMPPFALPKKKKLSGIKSASYQGNPSKNFSGIVINDNQGHEHLAIHSERHLSFNSEFDKVFHGGRHKGERVAVSNVFTVGHFPGGGGSGGGPNQILAGGGSGGAVGAPLGTPKAQGLLGLNSTMVYGENVQTAVGINHQLAVGSNYQICVNPAGLLSQGYVNAAEPILVSALGGGIGGNVQFTIGTSAQITYGRSFEINVGAPKVELNNSHQSENTASYLLCGLVGLLVLTYVVCYGIFDDDDVRANLTIAFQACLDMAFGVLVCMEGLKQQLGPDSEAAETVRKAVFTFNHVDWTVPSQTSVTNDEAGNMVIRTEWANGFFGLTSDAWEIIGAASAALGVAVAPLVVAAQNEHASDDDTQG